MPNYIYKNKIFTILISSLIFISSFFIYMKFDKKYKLSLENKKREKYLHEIDDINLKIHNLNSKISKVNFNNKVLFEPGQEAEEVYNLLSNLAVRNKLLLENISKAKIKNIFTKDVFPQENKNSKKENKILYTKITLEYQIVGLYDKYMQFRQQLANHNVILNIVSEKIKVVPDKFYQRINVKLILSTYRMGYKQNGKDI